MKPEFMVFGSPRIEEEEIAEIVSTLRSGWIGTGPKVAALDNAFRDYISAEYAAR